MAHRSNPCYACPKCQRRWSSEELVMFYSAGDRGYNSDNPVWELCSYCVDTQKDKKKDKKRKMELFKEDILEKINSLQDQVHFIEL